MDVTERDVENVRRISEQVFADSEHIDITEVEDSSDNVRVSVSTNEHADSILTARNAFAGDNLREYHEGGYVAVSVSGGNKKHSAWFERAETLDFGNPGPGGEHDLRESWSVFVAETKAVLRKGGDVVVHIPRDGWTLDEYVLHKIIPSAITQDLVDLGFEKGDVDIE